MKKIELKQDGRGQWQYRILQNGKVLVDWQYGPFDREKCIEQAKERFGGEL
jgi:hypothetical protein